MKVEGSTVVGSIAVMVYLAAICTNKAMSILLTLLFIGGIACVPYHLIYGRRSNSNRSRFGSRSGRIPNH